MFSFDSARRKAAYSSKLQAVGAKPKNKTHSHWLQRSVKKFPGWLGHINTPDIHIKIEYLIMLVTILTVVLGIYHFHPLLTYSDWFQSLINMVGYSSFVFVLSCGYGIYWSIKTNIQLHHTLLHILIASIFTAPVFTLSGFNGGELGMAITAFFEHGHIHKSIIAASAMLIVIHSSIHLGNPLAKLISVTELLVDPFYTKTPQSIKTKEANNKKDPQISTMQSILDAHKLEYAKVIKVLNGPLITTYEIQLPEGKNASPLLNAKTSIARSTRAMDVKIIEHVPGKSTCAIEVANAKPEPVVITDLVYTKAFKKYKATLKLCLGVDSYGKAVFQDLGKMPHLLVSGTTGAGKSVAIRSMLYSLMVEQTPDKLQLSLIDPKKVELSAFKQSPFLRHPVITEMSEAIYVLEAAVREMEERYTLIEQANKQDIDGYNKTNSNPLPWVVIVIEEAADLILQFPEVENLIVRLAQKARGAGMHLKIGTQYPTVNVITGLIKANISARLGMMVSSKTESRVILDQNGAETLRGNGDMYAKLPGHNQLLRVHAANISQQDIQALVKKQIQQYGKNEF